MKRKAGMCGDDAAFPVASAERAISSPEGGAALEIAERDRLFQGKTPRRAGERADGGARRYPAGRAARRAAAARSSSATKPLSSRLTWPTLLSREMTSCPM